VFGALFHCYVIAKFVPVVVTLVIGISSFVIVVAVSPTAFIASISVTH